MASMSEIPSLPIIDQADVKMGVINPIDPSAEVTARKCIADLKAEGEVALRRYAEKFGDIAEGEPLVLGKDEMRAAFESLPAEDQACLETTCARVTAFAVAQRASITEVTEFFSTWKDSIHILISRFFTNNECLPSCASVN